jgi:hypothetical protein
MCCVEEQAVSRNGAEDWNARFRLGSSSWLLNCIKNFLFFLLFSSRKCPVSSRFLPGNHPGNLIWSPFPGSFPGQIREETGKNREKSGDKNTCRQTRAGNFPEQNRDKTGTKPGKILHESGLFFLPVFRSSFSIFIQSSSSGY